MIPDEQTVSLWFHYEEIAMHFNELIIQYRLQVFGGAGILGGLFLFVFGKERSPRESERQYYLLRVLLMTLLVVVFLCAAALDLFYYRELLEGAVKAIVAFEAEHPAINMSTTIQKEFGWAEREIFWFVYIGLALFFISIDGYLIHRCLRAAS